MSKSIVVLNVGSSTVKLAEFKLSRGRLVEEQRVELTLDPEPDLKSAVYSILGRLSGTPVAFGHRLVHGGESFTKPTLLTPAVCAELRTLTTLAPLHAEAALTGIDVTSSLYPDLPSIGVFDTAFHDSRPTESTQYALHSTMSARYGVRRFGFHGIAHESLLETLAIAQKQRPDQISCVSLQLGSGCSACAIRNGRSIETSMGFTPLEGLVMMRRCGSIDAAAIFQLARAGLSLAQIERSLFSESGVTGVSGRSDMRDVLAAAGRDDEKAELAIALFCYSIVQTVGAYFTLLGGPRGLVFGGGIGANSPEVRARVVARLSAWHLELDNDANQSSNHGLISAPGSPVVYAFSTDEERVIARRTLQQIQDFAHY